MKRRTTTAPAPAGLALRAPGLVFVTRCQRILVIVVAMACLALCGCKTQLYTGLREQEANSVLAALLDAAIDAEKRPGGEGTYAIYVESGDFAQAVGLLDSLALPGRHFDDLGTVFGKVAMFSTPMEEKARYLYALQEELSQTVAAIDGVLTARVHLVLPEQDQLGRELQKPSAAVFVKHVDDPRHDPAGYQRDIRRLVAASIPNMEEDRIVVSFFPTPPREEPVRTTAWRNVLGVRVAEESASILWWAIGIAGAGYAALVGALFWLVLRKAKK